ncbi:MAG: lipopolysaccharide heptosyltransferase I [Acidobacteriota bacterium]
MSSAPASILVLRLSAFGDILHTLPAVASLRASFPPSTRLGWVVERPFRDLVELVAPVDNLFVASTKRWRKAGGRGAAWSEISQLRRQLRRFSRGEVAIDFQGLVKSSILASASGAADRFGFDARSVREKLSLLFTNRRVAVDRAAHVVDWNLQLAAAAGGSAPPPALDFSRFEIDPGGQLAPVLEAPVIVINPGAGHPSKRWPPARFAEVARASRTFGLEPLVIWGPGEEELAGEIVRESGAILAPETSLRQLAFILKRARLVVAADTGPLHLAAALGTPVIGLFGPTDPRRNGPYGQLDHCVQSFTAGRSMEEITASSVLNMVREII